MNNDKGSFPEFIMVNESDKSANDQVIIREFIDSGNEEQGQTAKKIYDVNDNLLSSTTLGKGAEKDGLLRTTTTDSDDRPLGINTYDYADGSAQFNNIKTIQ